VILGVYLNLHAYNECLKEQYTPLVFGKVNSRMQGMKTADSAGLLQLITYGDNDGDIWNLTALPPLIWYKQ